MAPTLYMVPQSPPVRSVQMTAKAIGLNLQLKQIDIMKRENRTSEYLKLNPQHTVPTLVDNDGFTVWDSHAINAYLISKYSKNDNMYPQDLQKRAIVDQRLHFDSGVAFPTGARIMLAIFTGAKKEIEDSDRDALNQVYGFLEVFLNGRDWMAGNGVTLADYHLYATITSLDIVVPVDANKYPKVRTWLKNVEDLPEAAENINGLEVLRKMVGLKISLK